MELDRSHKPRRSARPWPAVSSAVTGQLVVTADTFGNTGAASIPMALHAAREQGRLCPQSTVLHAAVGDGMSWAGTVQGRL
ncbi:3-oxoacyl-[acyl-carrier-protein] synthase III C-terminal domain-containing protein [Streptomyces sp. NPDC051704]|uniref:3-oxoacyl-[acyl-carrier-protein] synthase III C-terminal domain-containing protein n=1 Tax=Streptomyces sp. NPDC051704 TaxID=3365671 RepID=UPI00379DAD95